MSIYRVAAPNGRTYQIEGPPGASDADVINALIAQVPDAGKPPSTERTWGEAATDIGASLLSGAGSALQFPGQVAGLIPGLRGVGEALAAPGEKLAEYGTSLKSQGLKAREALRSKAMSDAEKEGVLAEFATAIKETVKDPALLSSFLTEQVPQLIGPAAAAKITTMLGRGAVEAATAGAAREAAAKALGAKATTAAVGTGAAMQGADIGEDTYKEAFKLIKAQNPSISDEDAQALALQKARVAALEAGAISVGAQRLPGARAIERRLAGLPGEGRIRGGLGEALGELVEEGGGAFAKNVGLQEIDPTRSLTAGIGTAAGLGALGGAGLGAITGAHPRVEATPTPGAEAPIDIAKRQAAEAEAQKVQQQAAIQTEREAKGKEYLDRINELAEQPNAFAQLALYGEELKQEPKSKERDEALRIARNKRLEILTGQVSEERATAEAAKGFMTAEEAAAAPITPRAELETPAEPAPSTVLDAKAISAIGFGKGGPKSVQAQLMGKDLTVPEDALAVRAVLEKYKEGKNANPKTVDKIDAFLAKMPQIVAPEVPSVGETVTEPSGAGVSVAGEPGGVSTPAGVGVTEPTGVVPAVTDVGQPTVRKTEQPSAVAKPAGKRVSLAKQIQGVNLAPQGVPDVALINQTFAQYPQYHNAVLYALGVDSEGHFLDKPLSLKEAAKAAGLGENAHSNLSKVLKQVGLTPEVREMYHAAQAGELAVGRTGVVGGEAKTEAEVGGDFTKRPWYTPITEKGVGGVNDTELIRAISNAMSVKPTPESQKVLADLVAESKKREKSPSFRQAFNEYTKTYVEPTEETQGETAAPDQVVGEGEEFEIPEIEDTSRLLSDEEPRYRTVPQTPVGKGISHSQLEKIVKDIGKALGKKVDITILDDVTDVAPSQKPGSRAGAVIKGRVYLFRSGIAEGVEGQKTIFHELFHNGLSNMLPKAEYEALLLKAYEQSADIRNAADAYLQSKGGKEDTKGMSPREAKALAVEEAFADIAEQTDIKPTIARQLGMWFANVADRLGLHSLARAIRTMGLDERAQFIREAIHAGAEGKGEGVTRYDRFRTSPQTQPIGVKEDPGFSGYVARTLGSSKIQGFRAKVADSLAGVDAFFADKYNGKIKDNQGNANPMVLLSRALDSRRFSKVAQEEGTLGVGPDGLTVAKKLAVDANNFTPEDLAKLGLIAGEEVSYLKALSEIPRTGLTKEQVGNLLIGHREYNLRALAKANKIDYEQTLDDATIDKYERQYQASNEVKRISQMLDAVRFSMIDEMVRSGRIDEKTSAEWKDATGYVPFSRIDALDNFYASGAPAKRGAAIYRNLKQISGDRTRQMENPLESFSGLIDWMTNESMKTEAASRALQEMSLFNAAQRIPAREALSNNQQGAIVETYIDGKKALYYVPDPALLGAFSYTQPEVSSIVKGFQKGSRVLRAGVTSMPAFVVKQVVDDITRMYTFAGLQNNREAVGRVLVNFPKNWFNEIMGRKSAGSRAMEERGLVGTFDFTDTGNVKNIMAEAGLEKRSFASRALQVMEAGAKASDLAVRQAIYEQVLKETGSVAEAENRAREIINFSRRGNAKIMDTMIRTVPFFNAFARGTDKLLVAAAGGKLGVGQSIGQPRAVFWKRMSTLTALATVYALMMSDDDEYNKLPDRVRDRNIILPLNKEFVQKYGVVPGIPLPADLAFIFKAIPERVIQYYRLQGTPEERAMLDISRELMKQGWDIFSTPNVTPQFLRPVVENMINYSFFLDRPLESQMQIANYRPFERYGAGTSDTAKKLAEIGEDIKVRTGVELTAISPIKIENFIRGMLGTIGGTALAVGDALINPSRTDRPLQQQLIPQLTGASTFMKDGISSRFLDEMYKLERDAEQAFSTHKRLREKGDLEGASMFLAQNYGIYAARDGIRSIMQGLRDANKLAMEVDKMTGMPADERRDTINLLKIRQTELARRAYEIRRQAAVMQMQMDKELSSKR